MMQTDCLSPGFILRETKRGALQRESVNENECEEKKRAMLPLTKIFLFRVSVNVRMSVTKNESNVAAFGNVLF